MKKLFLFDLDGTLVNSAPDLAIAVNKTLRDLQLTAFDEKAVEGWVGNGAKTLVERALSGSSVIKPDLDPAYVNTALQIFFDHYTAGLTIKTHLYEGVADTLGALQAAGHVMAVITNKPERFVAPILNELNIDQCFSLSIGGDTLTKKKPDPYPLVFACDKLGFSAEQAVMVGDSKNDILAAKSASIKSIGLTYGYNYGESIGLYEPDWVFDDFRHVLDIIDEH